MLVNACGMALYLRLASELWVLPGESGQPGGPGDAFYWLIFLLPILAIFLLINLVALAVIVWRRRDQPRLVAAGVWAIVALVWTGVVAVDHRRAFRTIDAPHAQT